MFIDVDYFLGLLHLVDVDDIADASEVHTASIFSVDFDPEDGGTIYLRSVGNLHTVNSTIINQHQQVSTVKF
jgi:hypothetical protein